jgi:2-iminobutanoate/2-iminopropanoate deaminase
MDAETGTQRVEIRVPELNPPISHYTDAVRFGSLLFVSGCAPVNQALELVGDDVALQARSVFQNLSLVLAAGGCSFADVLKVTVYLTDVDDREAVNEVRKEVFGESRPASTLIGVSALALKGMKVEVDAVAGCPSDHG